MCLSCLDCGGRNLDHSFIIRVPVVQQQYSIIEAKSPSVGLTTQFDLKTPRFVMADEPDMEAHDTDPEDDVDMESGPGQNVANKKRRLVVRWTQLGSWDRSKYEDDEIRDKVFEVAKQEMLRSGYDRPAGKYVFHSSPFLRYFFLC